MRWFAQNAFWARRDRDRKEITVAHAPKYVLWIMLLPCLLWLAACSGAAEPTPTPDVPLLPTLGSTTAVTATATIDVPLLPTVDPTVAAAAQSGLPTHSTPPVSPLTVTGSAALSITATITTTGILSNTPDNTLALTPAAVAEDCATDADIALTSYPDLIALMGCARQPASFEPVAINEFGVGPDYDRFMLWFSSENQIYVLLPSKVWTAYPDTWTEEQETFSCNPLAGEASSPPLPRRGFGKLWCSIAGLQETMGLVEREERLCQHTVTQRFQLGRLIACYEDATIRFFRVMDDETWDQVLTR